MLHYSITSASRLSTHPLDQPEAATVLWHRCGTNGVPSLAPGRGSYCAAAQCVACGEFLMWLSCHMPAVREGRRQRGLSPALTALALAYMAEALTRIDAIRCGG